MRTHFRPSNKQDQDQTFKKQKFKKFKKQTEKQKKILISIQIIIKLALSYRR